MYTKDLRVVAMRYLENHTYSETSEVFGVSVTTLKSWKRLLKENNSLDRRPPNKSATKFHDDELKKYMNEHPKAMLKEVATYFGGTEGGACNALYRIGYSQKKLQSYTQSVTSKQEHNTTSN